MRELSLSTIIIKINNLVFIEALLTILLVTLYVVVVLILISINTLLTLALTSLSVILKNILSLSISKKLFLFIESRSLSRSYYSIYIYYLRIL